MAWSFEEAGGSSAGLFSFASDRIARPVPLGYACRAQRRLHGTVMKVLAGDIGGTKTRLGLFEIIDARPVEHVVRTFASREHGSLAAIVQRFLDQTGARAEQACFGIAGPVRGRVVAVTNLPWVIDGERLERRFGFRRVALLNDLEATGWGIPALLPGDCLTLNGGEPDPGGHGAVIAAGTGLGEAGLFRVDNGFRPFASEGGHADFAPADELQWALHRFLARRHDHVSWERVISGPGLVNLHAFLCEYRDRPVPPEIVEAKRDGDPAAVIAGAALSGGDETCVEALDLFVRLYGAEAGNLALKTMATGGVYVAGGIAPRIQPALTDGRFVAAFAAKGRMQPLLASMPVHVILNDRVALYGPARYLTQQD